MTEYSVSSTSAGFVNLSPMAFHRWATHYYKCCQDFQCPDLFSPVPYFLLCRAIELGLKAKHLEVKREPEVKSAFGHDLVKAYEVLPMKFQQLSDDDLSVLKRANAIYASKGFEYINPEDALTGYSRFPNLAALDAVTKKLLGL